MSGEESRVERERRSWIERQERFKDRSEELETRRAGAATPEEREQLSRQFASERQRHREEDVALGKRAPGLAIAMRQNMWARWLEVAVEHELEAAKAFRDITSKPDSDGLLREFRASLIAVTAAAHTIEALFGDIKYLIPPRRQRAKRHNRLSDAFQTAFGISDVDAERLGSEFNWLFSLRDNAVHAYTELKAPELHPAGITTGAEHSLFNAITSRRAVDTAMDALRFARRPPQPANRWIERWASDRMPYHETVVDRLRQTR